jgi:hypothetical protein
MFSLSNRRFGVELEYNAFDGESRSKSVNGLPEGIYDIANYLAKGIGKTVEVNKWSYTNNNSKWVLKPDSSCGIEVCSPPLRSAGGCNQLREAIQQINTCEKVNADERCSMHVHIEIEDLNLSELAYLIEKWVNFEPFFFLLTNDLRWLNQYCVPLGFAHQFASNEPLSLQTIIDKLAEYKYYVINLYHYVKNRKKTIEFRCMGNEGCLNSDDAINWIKLLICFVDRCKNNKQLSPLNFEYKSVSEALNFLQLHKFFNDDEVIMWVISKLSLVLDQNFYDCFQWDSIIKVMKKDILATIENLEKNLL